MAYSLSEHHLFERFGKTILFNVATMLFYEITPVAAGILACVSANPDADPRRALKGKFSRAEIKSAIRSLEAEGFLRKEGSPPPETPPALTKRWGIRHLELMITHGCNMACRYCYGSDGTTGDAGSAHLYGSPLAGMAYETAVKGIDFLFHESGPRKEVSVIFFGGEPLLEFPLIERIVPYIRDKERETGKKADISLSSNGLLLDRKIVDFLAAQKIGCQISIDGPPEAHDRLRSLRDGSPSYEAVMIGVSHLMAARRGKVPARATLSRGATDALSVVEHLLSLGFGSVHLEPAIGRSGETAITSADVEAIKRQEEALALFLVKRVRENRYFNYSNLVKYIRQTRVVRERLAYYCGAARTYFALSRDGAFYPCHRFVGMEEYRMGDVDSGLDTRLRDRILGLTVDQRPYCRECWARYFCGGGCWKHAVDMSGTLEEPDHDLSCEITRHRIECALAINSELRVEDKDILSDLYEEAAEPYLVTGERG